MSELVKFAKSELRAAGLFDPDADYDGAVATSVVAIMETFTSYGHSGGSAAQTLNLFEKLAAHKPITPLTGADDEWTDMSKYSDGHIWQNKRCPTVFKDKDRAWITLPGSVVKYISFPYSVE